MGLGAMPMGLDAMSITKGENVISKPSKGWGAMLKGVNVISKALGAMLKGGNVISKA